MTQAEILALPASATENRMIYATDTKNYLVIPKDQLGSAAIIVPTSLSALLSSPSSTPYNAGATITGDITLNAANGLLQKLTLTGVTVARTFNVPTNGTEGMFLTARVKSTTGVARTLAMHASIVLPTDAGLVFPKSLTENKTYLLKLYYNGTAWELVSLVGGY